jgi:hypothetical protein
MSDNSQIYPFQYDPDRPGDVHELATVYEDGERVSVEIGTGDVGGAVLVSKNEVVISDPTGTTIRLTESQIMTLHVALETREDVLKYSWGGE